MIQSTVLRRRTTLARICWSNVCAAAGVEMMDHYWNNVSIEQEAEEYYRSIAIVRKIHFLALL